MVNGMGDPEADRCRGRGILRRVARCQSNGGGAALGRGRQGLELRLRTGTQTLGCLNPGGGRRSWLVN